MGKHHCGEAAWASKISNADPSVKEGCVVEVRQTFRSVNKMAEAVLLVGQKGIVKVLDTDGYAQVHFLDHAGALQWISYDNMRNLSLVQTPPSTPKPVAGAVSTTSITKQKHKFGGLGKSQIMKVRSLAALASARSKTTGVDPSSGSSSTQQSSVVKEQPSKGIAALVRNSKASQQERQKFEALAACRADAQIEYKQDGKTAASHPGSYKRYEAYAKATTIPEALVLGASGSDIVYDFKLGVLKIIHNGTPSAEGDRRFNALVNNWKRRAEGEC